MKIGFSGSGGNAQIYSELGFDYFEPPVYEEIDDQKFSILTKNIEQFNLKPEVFNCFLPASLPIVGPNVEQANIYKYLNKVLPRIKSLGGKIVVLGSGKARNIPHDYLLKTAKRQFLNFLDMATEVAGDKVKIVIEPLCKKQTNLLNYVTETREVCQNVDWIVGLLADLYHMTEGNEPIANLEPVFQLAHIHIPFPEDTYPIDEFIHILKAGGYKMRVTLEDNGKVLSKVPDEEHKIVLAKGLDYIRSLI